LVAMEMRCVGATGLRLSAFGLGAVEFCGGDGSRGEPTLRESSAAVAAAIESGVNWLDTADESVFRSVFPGWQP
jgi:aryl-alcohol dehydrogenase-like predicted oxidoreductase